MTSRFLSNLVLLVLSAVLAASRFALPVGADRWLTLGAGCAAVIVVAAGFLARGRGTLQRWLDLPMAVLGAWTIVSAAVFLGSTGLWLMLGEAAGMAALALAGLIAHEARMEAAVQRGRVPGYYAHAGDGGVAATAAAAPLSLAGRQS
jgi:hypothetical protein